MKLFLFSILLLQVPLALCTKIPAEQVFKNLEQTLPNFALTLKKSEADKSIYEIMPEQLQKSVKNGIRCENKMANIEELLSKAMYTDGATDAVYTSTKKQELEDMEKNFGFKCATPGTSRVEKCACDDTKFLPHCAAIGFTEKDANQPEDCDAMTRLKGKGFGMVAALYDYQNMAANKQKFEEAFSTEEKAIAAFIVLGGLLCDALNNDVEVAVRDLMRLDIRYYLVEEVLSVLVFGPEAKASMDAHKPYDRTNVCKTENFQNDFGRCLCKGDLGMQFCLYKAIALEFKKQGVLDDCSTMTKDSPVNKDGKKPAKMPTLRGKADSSSSSGGAKSAAAAAAAVTPMLLPVAALFAR